LESSQARSSFFKRFRFDGKGQTKAAARLLPEKGAAASTELAMSQ